MNTSRRLTRTQLYELEAELHAERTRLERSLAEHDHDGGESWAAVAADGESGAAGGAGVLSGLKTQADARYDAIVAALGRIATGSYGTCAGCQQPIPYGRLIVMPEVTYCVACPSRV